MRPGVSKLAAGRNYMEVEEFRQRLGSGRFLVGQVMAGVCVADSTGGCQRSVRVEWIRL